jgi:hypothetical protein
LKNDKKNELYTGTKIISNPQNVASNVTLNTFSVERTNDILNQNSSKNNAQLSKQWINWCPKTIVLYPVPEYEIV